MYCPSTTCALLSIPIEHVSCSAGPYTMPWRGSPRGNLAVASWRERRRYRPMRTAGARCRAIHVVFRVRRTVSVNSCSMRPMSVRPSG